jgi:predicted MFS family arabinose efflux permease
MPTSDAPGARDPAAVSWRTPALILIAGCLISLVGFGVRSAFGIFLEPMTLAQGWSRETFALAMAIQNLFWGLGLPFAGALADRFGAPRVLAVGAVLYALGVAGMALSESGLMLQLTGGVLTGLGVAFTAFSIAIAAMAKVVGPERRSLALGMGTAAGSAGQVIFSPLGQALIASLGWYDALLIVGMTTLLIIPLAFILPGITKDEAQDPLADMTIGAALREAGGHRGYILLTAGFFVCGFHIAFITVHFPAYITGLGLDPAVGGYALALIGLFNIVGSFASGAFGQRWSKRCGLSGIYFLRAIAITALLMAPKTEATILIFAATMGALWLSTVPLTTGLVAQIFGVRYMATLFGIVFLSHQIGSFIGVWLGGYLYDTVGSYDAIWWAGVVLGLFAAIVHLPIDERPLQRQRAPA